MVEDDSIRRIAKDVWPSEFVWINSVILAYPWDSLSATTKELFTVSGDEDWLVVVPPEFADLYIPFVQGGYTGSIGVCSVEEFEHDGMPGYKFYVGTHS